LCIASTVIAGVATDMGASFSLAGA
jgi:hypothetical protein